MQIQLNGKPRELREPTTIAQLVASLELNPKLVAVERNTELVRRAKHAEVELVDGDAVEIVTLVGGG